jgi:hypothetical protein
LYIFIGCVENKDAIAKDDQSNQGFEGIAHDQLGQTAFPFGLLRQQQEVDGPFEESVKKPPTT